jgi:SH3-like domain-containing protein
MAPREGALCRSNAKCAALTTGVALMLCTQLACSVDFRSVGPAAVILYDAPSLKARRLFILNQGYPVEIVVTLEGWYKVRDGAGGLAWVEAKDLSARRMVMVKIARAEVRKAPEENAPVLFRADQDVLLELLGTADNWAHVKHSDGAAGYIRITQVWGL